MGELFGTDGIRGEAGKYPLDERTVEWIGHSLGRRLRAKTGWRPRVVVGRDTRESGFWIERALARGLMAAGAEALFAGVITTPGVAYLTRTLQAEAGTVISASHNPFEDNGIKIFSPTGQKLDDATETGIESDLKAGPTGFPESFGEAEVAVDETMRTSYLGYLRHELGSRADLKGLRIAVDCANGAASGLASELFSSLGAKVKVINADPDGRNINLDCGSLHPEKLQRLVVETGCHLGAAFDGDADRLVMVDEAGNLIDGDQILYVIARYLHERGDLDGNRVVATVMSNLGLEQALAGIGVTLARTAVGDKNVLDELLSGGGSIGGEQSGHIIFPKISLAGDGMLSALEVLRVCAETGSSLGSLTAGMKRLPQLVVNIKVASKPPFDSVPELFEAIRNLETEIETRGRLLVRYSGTENKLRIMIEGEDMPTIQAQADALAGIVKQTIGR